MADMYIQRLSIALFVMTFGLELCLVSTSAELQRFNQPLKDDGSLSFLVIGDWGRRGSFNQSQVAVQMGRVGEKLGIDFVVSTGDNFYDNGLTSVQDNAFDDSFTKIYTAKSLQKQWYSVLGNHDYRGNVLAQLSHHLKAIDSRWVCLRSFIVNAGLAELFFVDTTPFVKSYFIDPEGHRYDWRGIGSRKAYITGLTQDLDMALKKSSAKWKIVVGHHGIRSIGHHGDTKELVENLLPVLEANNVDFYMNGHDHCLEHIADTQSPLQFLTSGAGSKAWRGDVKDRNRGLKFYYDGQGFMSVQLNTNDTQIAFYDVLGNVIHTWHTTKVLHHSSIIIDWKHYRDTRKTDAQFSYNGIGLKLLFVMTAYIHS